MKCIAISFVILLSLFVLCFTHYDDYGQAPAEPRLLETSEDLKDFLDHIDEDPAVVGYFDSDSSPDYEVFRSVAETAGANYKFAYVWDKDITKDLKLSGTTVYVHKPSKKIDAKLDKLKARYPSKNLNAKSLLKFVYEKALPTIGVKDMYTKEYYNNVKVPTMYVFLDTEKAKNEAGYKYVTTRLNKVVAKYPDQFVYALVNRKDDETDFREYEFPSNLHSKRGDVTVGLKVQDTVYTMLKSFSVDNLIEFVEEYKKDTLVGRPAAKRSAKTPPPPSEEDDEDSPDHVVTLTGDNFKELVTDASADAMVEFYAPWCGHCKSLKPEYKKLADYFKDDSNVVIAAMDADAHKPPAEYSVSGYPTVYYLPRDTKKPVAYDGERSYEAMKDFILSQRK